MFDKIKKNAIKFDLKSKSKEELPIGISKFGGKPDLPYYEKFNEIYDYEDWDEYDEIRVSKGYEEEEVINKLLGYANVIQNGMLIECEKVTNEIYCGNEIDIDSEKLKQMEKNCSQWQLLFQLDTVIMDDFELMFGDCGRIYFYIKKDDLKNCKFDDCWLILQCC